MKDNLWPSKIQLQDLWEVMGDLKDSGGQGHGVVRESEGALERLEGRGQRGHKSRGGGEILNPWEEQQLQLET